MKKKPATKAPGRTLPAPLPAGILDADVAEPLRYGDPAYKRPLYEHEFELWFTDRMGWVIPTLLIRAVPSRMAGQGLERRSYGVVVATRALVMVGLGPHVKATVRVFVYEDTRARLQPFLDLKREGLGKAGETRDRISTRRANTTLRRRAPWDQPW